MYRPYLSFYSILNPTYIVWFEREKYLYFYFWVEVLLKVKTLKTYLDFL